jgi:hypothetical protein
MSGPRPLLNTAADQRLFVADESRRRALAATEKPHNVLIRGAPGSGKSSLLYRALSKAHARRQPALLLSGRLAEDSRSLTDLLLAQAAEEGWLPDAPRPDADDPLGPARQLRRLRDAPEDSLVLVDDLNIEQARSLFGQFRDELWQTPVRFVAAVRPEVSQVLSEPPADAFFDRRFTLEPLAGKAAAELLRRRADAGESTLIYSEPQAALQPRALVASAAEDAPAGRYDPVRQAELLRLAENVAGRSGAMLLAELWGRDGVSASDPDLQRTLGVTRNRLTELLRTLGEHGVLSTYVEPREGKPGRPRVIYTVRQQ